MNMTSTPFVTLRATFFREVAEHRLNRFLHVHVGLCAVAGLLPLFTPEAAARSAPLWALQAVLYCLSLSSLLLGLSSAQGDADEFPLILTHPLSLSGWIAGKAVALAALLLPASLLLVAPAALTSGGSVTLLLVGMAAAAVCLVLALTGLAVGFWVRDHVRGLLASLGVWFGLLFGTDLVLLALSGAPWVHARQALWVLPIMLNPLSALRVTVLFGIEGIAPAGVGASTLVLWWLAHGGLWLTLLLAAWIAGTFGLGLAGARRRVDL
jgi:Cu-processing system permease protein